VSFVHLHRGMKRELMISPRTIRARGTVPPPVAAAAELERPVEHPAASPAVPSGRTRAAYQAAAPTSRLITIG